MNNISWIWVETNCIPSPWPSRCYKLLLVPYLEDDFSEVTRLAILIKFDSFQIRI